MQILFGPSQDARHIEPDAPNGYEWWYFDAISDNYEYTLVVIFFLGTPMSPYYKAVVDGKNPLPQDWCGVFVSLHEHKRDKSLIGASWYERAYAYNLYRGGKFATNEPVVKIGNSEMYGRIVDGQWCWHLSLNESCLWRGEIKAEIDFTLQGNPLTPPPVAESDDVPASDHHWACVAPRCRAGGNLSLADGKVINFSGTGYHDHNFGTLPWYDAAFWFWTRTHFREDSQVQTAVLYRTVSPVQHKAQSLVLLFDNFGQIVAGPVGTIEPQGIPSSNMYGFHHEYSWHWQAQNGLSGWVESSQGDFSNGPFYLRFSTIFGGDRSVETTQLKISDGLGIGEVFQPSRLCGPIASRAMWTRMRRRS